MYCVWQVVKTPTIIFNNPVQGFSGQVTIQAVLVQCCPKQRCFASTLADFSTQRFQWRWLRPGLTLLSMTVEVISNSQTPRLSWCLDLRCDFLKHNENVNLGSPYQRKRRDTAQTSYSSKKHESFYYLQFDGSRRRQQANRKRRSPRIERRSRITQKTKT